MRPRRAAKKLDNRLAALFGEHAVGNRGVVIQAGFGEQVDDAAGGAGLRIARAENHAFDARMHDRAGAHGAGFQGHIQGATGQAVVAQTGRRVTQGHDFSMRRRIVPTDGLIETATDDLAIADNQRTHRHFTGSAGFARQIERQCHVSVVVHEVGLWPAHPIRANPG